MSETVPQSSSDRGASIAMLALTLMMLLGASAIALDIAVLWLERSTDQKVTDSAAAAGVLEAITTDGQEACETALSYVAVNAPEIASVDDSGCATAFSTSCTSGESLTVSTGRFTITVTYPVADADPLMTSGIVGATTQALDPSDRQPCDRLGVEMTAVRDSIFAQILGTDSGTVSVHTVATARREEDGPPINLLVLERTGCQTIHVQGNGGIVIDAVVTEDEFGNPIGLVEGIAASDSDGSDGCTSDGVIDVDGSGSLLRADGPEGCPDQSGTHSVDAYVAGEGCGLVQTYAPGTPGCGPGGANTPACTPGSGGSNRPQPEPTSLSSRLTRERVDHRFNCWTDYTSPPAGVGWASDPLTGDQTINECISGDPDYVYDLINAVGSTGKPTGSGAWSSMGVWSSWNADLGYPCSIDSSASDITVNGNVVFDCASLDVKRHVRVNGNAVFDGDVSVTSSDGHLDIRNSLGSPGWAFFRGGTLTKDGSGSLTFDYTAVYMSKTSGVAMSGGSGSLTWIAPDSGYLDDLALWSDSSSTHFWAGQAGLSMEGVFFTPRATGDYSGTSGQNQTKAQWIADRLVARGQGNLVIQPAKDRGIPFGNPVTTLIR